MKTFLANFSLALLISACFTNNILGQTSVVKDAKGETSLNLGNKGVVAVSTKDESIAFSYGGLLTDKQRTNFRRLTYLGALTKGKAKSGIGSLAKAGDVQWDGSLGMFLFSTKTFQEDKKLNRADHLYFGVDYLRSYFKVFDMTRAFENQVFGRGVGGFKATLGFNQENQLGNKLPYVVGVSLSAGQTNNTADLKTMEISTTTSYTDPGTNTVRTVEKDQENAYDISLYKGALSNLNVNMDFGPQVAKRFLILIHPRYSIQQGRKPQWNPAAGIYLSKENSPLEVVAGLQVQVLDWRNTAEVKKNRGERTVLNLVAGFSF